MSNTPKPQTPTTLTPTQRVEQEINQQYSTHQAKRLMMEKLLRETATELEAAQKQIEYLHRNELALAGGDKDLRQQLADKTRECEETKRYMETWATEPSATQDIAINQLRAENAELKKDKERLDWLEEHHKRDHYGSANEIVFAISRNEEPTLRTAIDAARKEQE